MFPLQAAYSCQLLPHVIGATVSEYYELIWLPGGHRLSFFRSESPTWLLFWDVRSCQGLPSSWCFSPHIPRSSWTPTDPPDPHHSGSIVLASGTLKPSPSALFALTGLYQASGSAVSLTVCVVPCVRFNCFVRFAPPHSCNTRYEWLVKPYSAETLTLQEAPSFAWRTNAANQRRGFLRRL